MPTLPLSDEILRQAVDLYREYGKKSECARILGIDHKTFANRLKRAEDRGFTLSDGAKVVVDRARLSPVEAQGGWIHDYDDDGKKVGTTRWTKPRIEDDPLRWTEALKDALSEVPLAVQMDRPNGPKD